MRAPHDRDRHCLRCGLRRDICICSILPVVRTQTEFVILRHVGETNRPSNTGRLVALAMPNARIVSCGGGERIGSPPLDEALLKKPGTWLLWPDGINVPPDHPGMTRPRRIVVLDATWHLARRLFARTPALQSLPRLALPAPASTRERLRDQRRADGMSTIEAVASAVSILEGAETAEPLARLYDEVVRRTMILRWGPSGRPGPG